MRRPGPSSRRPGLVSWPADETRRRLERDLHDGIQQRLVSLALKARATETMTPQPPNQIQGALSLLADGLGTALDELREISRGIHPAVLSEAGLGAALKALARRCAVPVALDLNLGPRLGGTPRGGRLLRRVRG